MMSPIEMVELPNDQRERIATDVARMEWAELIEAHVRMRVAFAKALRLADILEALGEKDRADAIISVLGGIAREVAGE